MSARVTPETHATRQLQIGQHATPIHRQICIAKWIYASGPLRDCARDYTIYTSANFKLVLRIYQVKANLIHTQNMAPQMKELKQWPFQLVQI
jgi:hypothetical protein